MPPTSPSQNTQYLAPFGVGQPGSPVQGGGGSSSSIQDVPFRDPLDAARSRFGAKTPSAEYPDGYLGTIKSRREDRLLDSIKNNLNTRGYQRGVHKGERIEPSDYFWPNGFGNDAGIARQMAAVYGSDGQYHVQKPSPTGTIAERLTIMGERTPVRGSELLSMDPRAVSNLDRLRPAWS